MVEIKKIKKRKINKGLKKLVKSLIDSGVLKDKRIIKAFLEVDRKLFVPPYLEKYAYLDIPLPIGHGATISQPTIVATMLEALELEEGQKVLEIGAGSGYVVALISKIVGENGYVIGIELIPELAEQAKERLKALGIKNAKIVCGDGSIGYPEEAPYDRILASAAFPSKPMHLLEQLKDYGIIVAPVGVEKQNLIKIIKNKNEVREIDLGPVIFVPMYGKYGIKYI